MIGAACAGLVSSLAAHWSELWPSGGGGTGTRPI